MQQAGFILLTIALALILYRGTSRIAVKAFTDTTKQRLFTVRTGVFVAAWLFFITGISLTGIFTSASMPPRIPLLLVLPTFLFMAWFFISGRFKNIIEATPVSWVIYLQSFRIIVELLIWGASLTGVVPREATFRGFNYDIIFGLTAPMVAYAVGYKKPALYLNFLIWNFCGLVTLALVVFTLISYAYFPGIWGRQTSILTYGFGMFPYTLLAGFFMPLAVFLHIFAIIKITQMMNMKLP